jgi:hypothetical protein
LAIHPAAVGKPACPPLASPPPAGFPSPAGDYPEPSLDPNARLVKNLHATFPIRVAGDSMIGAGIHPGDPLVVDKSLEPYNNYGDGAAVRVSPLPSFREGVTRVYSSTPRAWAWDYGEHCIESHSRRQ